MLRLPARIVSPLALIAALGLVAPAAAEANLIANGDFELADGADKPAAWRTNEAPNTTFTYETSGGPAGAGDAFVKITSGGNPGSPGSRWSSSRATATPETEYEVAFDYLGNSGDFMVRIDFFANGAYVSGVESEKIAAAAAWESRGFTFTTPANVTQIEVVFKQRAWGGNVSMDNVVVDVVPEPASAALVVGGLLGLSGLRR